MSDRIYVWGDGAIWRISKKALKQVAQGAYACDVGRMMSAEQNIKTGQWRNLPKGIDQDQDGQLWVSENGVELFAYDDHDDLEDYANNA